MTPVQLGLVPLALLGPARDSVPRAPIVAVFAEGAFDISDITTAYSPLFVLYNDGTVIYCVRHTQHDLRYDSLQLTSLELKALMDSLSLNPAFFQLDSSYDNAPNASDMPTYSIWAWHNGSGKRVSLRGTLDSASVAAKLGGAPFGARTPSLFLQLYNRLCTYRHARAVRWRPTHFELILSQFDFAHALTPWPASLPGLTAAGVHRDQHGAYHIPLNPEQATTFLKHYSATIHTKALRLSGRNWFGVVRVVFPAEDAWIRW